MSYGSLDHWKVVCKKSKSNLKDEKVITLLSPVQDIVTHRGTVCNQKGSPRVHWIIETLPAKNQGLKLRDKKVISF